MTTNLTRVLVTYSDHGTALTAANKMIPFQFRKGMERPLAGDVIDIDDEGRLSKIHDRRTLFGRGDHRGNFKPTAANIDQLLIVIAPEPKPSLDLVTRYLVMAELQSIHPIIIVNKSDLGIPKTPPFEALNVLSDLGYCVVTTSTLESDLQETLEPLVEQKISVLAGQSGVGKSSLLNALVPNTSSLTNQLSSATGKGRHTTTTTRMYPLPTDGFLVDSPGVWEYGLWSIPTDELAATFIDFSPYLGQCRFRDCTHDHEPGCAIRKAVEEGKIPSSRHEAWRRLLSEQERYEN